MPLNIASIEKQQNVWFSMAREQGKDRLSCDFLFIYFCECLSNNTQQFLFCTHTPCGFLFMYVWLIALLFHSINKNILVSVQELFIKILWLFSCSRIFSHPFCIATYLMGSEIPLKQFSKQHLQGLIFGATLHAVKQTKK